MRVLRPILCSIRRFGLLISIFVVLFFFNSILVLNVRSRDKLQDVTTKSVLKTLAPTVNELIKEPIDYVENPLSRIDLSFPEVPPIQENLISFIHDPMKICQNDTAPQILIVVHSAVNNFQNREILRRTLGKYDKYNGLETRIIFVTGGSDSKDTMLKLDKEAFKYGDILTISVEDKYTRMVYKAVAWMKWIVNACVDIKHVIKIDDDTFLHMFKLSEMLDTCHNSSKVSDPICSKMSCHLWTKFKPHRRGKYSLSMSEYSQEYFPPFCPGVAVFIPGELVPRLLEASTHVQFLWLDDVYLTGLLMHYLGESHYNFAHKITNTVLKNYKHLDVGKMLVGHFNNDVINGVYESHWKIIERKFMKT